MDRRHDFEITKLSTKAPEYQYNLKDHLGNIRTTFTTVTDMDEVTATFETAAQATEASQFLRYDDTRLVNSTLFDHTDGAGTMHYAERLNGSANEKTGLVKTLSVMPGDQIHLEVYGKYVDPDTTNWTGTLGTLMNQIATGTAPAGVVVDGAGYPTNGGTPFPFAGLTGTDGSTGTGPKAYLNYIIFDRNFVLLDAGYVRMTTAAKETGTDVNHELLSKDITIAQAGYLYTYLSNDEATPVEVYFDDFNVKHTKSPVIQSEDYYPFGLTFNSYSRENSVPNKYLFNKGSELQTDLGLDVYYTRYREYDPAIGRWWQVDPKADIPSQIELTPYNFGDDDPILKNDPDGDCPVCPILRKLAQQGVKWASRTVKGEIKQVSRQQAVKILEKKGTVYQVEKNSNKAAKALMKEAKPGQKIVRHDGHKLPNGETGMPHFQPKAGDGSHVNYMKSAAVGAAATAAATDANAASTNTTGQAEVNPVDAVVDAVSNSTPQGQQINMMAGAGKSVFGNNAVGNFIDNWINPAGLGKDVMDLTIMGAMMMSSDKK